MNNKISPIGRKSSAAFNVERARDFLMQNVQIPEALITKVFNNLEKELDATYTKVVTHRGAITDTIELPNWDARLRAQDQLIAITGLTVKKEEAKPTQPNVAVRVDPVTGVVELVVMHSPIEEAPSEIILEETAVPFSDVASGGDLPEAPTVLQPPPIYAESASVDFGGLAVPEELPVVFKKNGRTPKAVLDILFGKEPEDV